MQRPMGVTIIAVLGIILGALVALVGLLFLFRGSASFIGEMSFYGGAATLADVVLIGLGVLVIVTSVGLLKVQEWARVLAVVLNVVHLVVAAMGLMEAFRYVHTPSFLGTALRHIVMIAIGAWIIVYLVQPRVKQVFRGPVSAAS